MPADLGVRGAFGVAGFLAVDLDEVDLEGVAGVEVAVGLVEVVELPTFFFFQE